MNYYGRQRLYDFRTPSEEINAQIRPWVYFLYLEEQEKKKEEAENDAKRI